MSVAHGGIIDASGIQRGVSLSWNPRATILKMFSNQTEWSFLIWDQNAHGPTAVNLMVLCI
jgi:hypothetical protein